MANLASDWPSRVSMKQHDYCMPYTWSAHVIWLLGQLLGELFHLKLGMSISAGPGFRRAWVRMARFLEVLCGAL